MRLTNQMMLNDAVSRMADSSARVEKYRRQAASGKKFERPSDDPQAAVRGLQLRSTLQTHGAYLDTARVTNERMQANELALGDLVKVLGRSIDLALQGRSDTQGPAERRGIAEEVNGLIEHAIGIGNTTHRGNYIFSGFQVHTEPYSFNGTAITNLVANTAGPVRNQIEPGNSLQVNVDGNAVLRPAFDAMLALRDALNANDMTALSTALGQLKTSLDGVTDARTVNGARLRELSIATQRMESTDLSLKGLLSSTEDVDLAEAIANLKAAESVNQAVLETSRRAIPQTLFDFLR
jgi:flagellar hook-associated protein 3 FlgL